MKPFTSKHCMQYLTKESPCHQEKESKLKEQYREKTGPTGIVADKRTFKPKVFKKGSEPQKLYKDVDGVVRDENNKDAGHPNPGLSPIKD